MIKITAESKDNQTELTIKIEGKGETIVSEAVHIMQQLPKQIKGMNKALYFRFLADLTETVLLAVGTKSEDPEYDDAKALADKLNEEERNGIKQN